MSTVKKGSAASEIKKLNAQVKNDSDILTDHFLKASSKRALIDLVIETHCKVEQLESEIASLKINDHYRHKMIQLLDRKINNLEKRISKYEKRNKRAKRSGN